MKKSLKSIISVLMIVTLLFSTQGSFAVDNDGLENQLTEYKMEVLYDNVEKSLTVTETIDFTNIYGDDLNQLVLHLYPDSYESLNDMPLIGGHYEVQDEKSLPESMFGNIDILRVKANDKELSFSEDNQILDIELDETLKSGDEIQLVVEFTVDLPEGRNRIGYFENVVSLTNWYPIMSIYDENMNSWDENPYHPIGESNYSHVSNYNVSLIVPKEMKVASTGVTVNEEANEETKTVNIEASNVRDFVIVMSENYGVISTEVDGIKINSFYLKSENSETSKESAEILLEIVADSVGFLNETIGEYPYEELDIMETYLSGGAMEYPQLIQMGKYGALDKNYKEQNRVPFLIEAAVHETIHQWWYVTVGSNEYEEPFMDESMTVYTTAYYFEKNFGKYHNNATLMQIRGRVHPYQGTSFDSSVDDFQDWGEYSNVIYSIGPIVLEDLRELVGEEEFVDILSTYYERNKFKNGSIKKLLEVISEKAGDDVKEKIEEALTSEFYYPEHVTITQEEHQELNRIQQLMELKQRQQEFGMSFTNIYLKGLEGETIYLIVPDKTMIPKDPSNYYDGETGVDRLLGYYIRSFESSGIKYKVKKQSEAVKSDLRENIILLGDFNENELIKDLQSYFPINRSSDWLLMDDLVVKAKGDVHGAFIMENPYYKYNSMMVVFWDDARLLDSTYFNYASIWYDTNQFKIYIGDTKQILGRYEQ
ncbi:M1 family metallopeptidase [Sporosalibacterium faouarense]|uniref:M1 family metallopeptidase n=1 Tax=Sporosalibacterium faouarense TaxID=516123 RepID=UPI00192A7B57|nr:M1 family metallopeptidase [Sporosalibacterium faouarense]